MANRSLFWLSKRNTLAGSVIIRYATGESTAGGALSLVRSVVPGAGVLSMVGSMAMQAPTVYGPMVRELVAVYAAEPEAIAALAEPTPNALAALNNPDSEAFGAFLTGEFGQEFFLSTLTDMIPELGIGAATNMLPAPLRALTGTGLDSKLTTTLTWRVGIMAILFFFNDWAWVESKSRTNTIARRIVGKSKGHNTERVSLGDLLQRLPVLHARAAVSIADYIEEWRRSDPALTEAMIRTGLRDRGVSADLVDAALKGHGTGTTSDAPVP